MQKALLKTVQLLMGTTYSTPVHRMTRTALSHPSLCIWMHHQPPIHSPFLFTTTEALQRICGDGSTLIRTVCLMLQKQQVFLFQKATFSKMWCSNGRAFQLLPVKA